MQLISHIAFAAGIGGLAGAGPHELAALTAGAAFPDVMDGVIAGGRKDIWRGVHRTVSHWPVLYPLVMAFLTFFGPEIPHSILRGIQAFLSGALLHISCDFCTPMGIPLHPPFTKRAGLKLIRTGSIWDYVVGFMPGIVYGLVSIQQSSDWWIGARP